MDATPGPAVRRDHLGAHGIAVAVPPSAHAVRPRTTNFRPAHRNRVLADAHPDRLELCDTDPVRRLRLLAADEIRVGLHPASPSPRRTAFLGRQCSPDWSKAWRKW